MNIVVAKIKNTNQIMEDIIYYWNGMEIVF
jgi:hypothetical protein